MNVLYTCDETYVWIMCVSMASLFENNKDSDEVFVFLLGEGISLESEKKLAEVAERYERRLTVIPTDNFRVPSFLCSKRWPKSAYMRLFSGLLLPKDLKTIVYIDCDTIICDSVQPLVDACMDDAVFRGVMDCVSSRYKRNIGLGEASHYINAGVLIIDLEALRDIDVESVVSNFLSQYADFISYSDQDILNGAFSSSITIFPEPSFNLTTQLLQFNYHELSVLRHPEHFYEKNDLESALRHPRIIHFTTCMLTIRPWFIGSDHPRAFLFDEYLAKTPFRNHRRGSMKFRGKEAIFFRVLKPFPKPIQLAVLGYVHAVLKPAIKRLHAYKGGKGEKA